MLLLLALSPLATAGDILLNEVLYDPSGSDGGAEWIELCNAGSETVDLTDWQLQVTSSGAWTESYTWSAGSIAPGEYLYLGPAMDTGEESVTFSPNLPNATSATAGMRLLMADGSTISDTLIYGHDTNTHGFADDEGDTDQIASDTGSGESLYRWPDCTDSGDSSVDFSVSGEPTPGFENEEDTGGGSTGGGGADCDGEPGLVVINEFVADPAGTDADAEWVELYNADTVAVDLTGWVLAGGTSSFSSKVELSGTMEPAEYLVVGGELVDFAHIVGNLSLGNAGSNSDGIQLQGCQGYTDTVIYGELNEDDWTEDTGELATEMAPQPKSGVSIGRVVDGVDTDVSGADFALLDFASPGAPNDTEPTCEGQDDVKINEFLPDPDGADEGYEWVELHNAGSAAVDLTGWVLRKATSGSSSSDFALPEGTVIEAGGFLLLGASLVDGADVVFGDDEGESELSLGNASSNGDSVVLVHCGGVAADIVVYGPNNEDGLKDDTGEVVTDQLAPKPSAGQALARCGDGTDSDDSSVDFWEPEVATPGAANTECIPPVCEAGSKTIKINEVLYNPAGSDTDYEWVELYNAGDTDQALDQWVFQSATSEWKDVVEFPGGTTIPAGGFLLIGDAAVPAEARDIEANLSLGNGGTAPDGARLVDCEGTLQDTVLWGDEEDLENELFDDQELQTMVPLGEDGTSAGRYPDGVDSDDNDADFVASMPLTPGRANEEGGSGSGTGGDGGLSKGCSKRSDGSDGPSKGCAAASPVGAWAWLLGAMVLVRRRRA